MKFDVIIGNPPYQLNDRRAGASSSPLYHLFIEQAIKLSPSFIVMIVPARWYSGGKGLDKFRATMLADRRMKRLIDFIDSRDCFQDVEVSGGICYFLWDASHRGPCSIETHRSSGNIPVYQSERYLDELCVFIRDGISVEIIRKVLSKSSNFLDTVVSSRSPFGLDSTETPLGYGDLTLVSTRGTGLHPSSTVDKGLELIPKYKVLLSRASNDFGGQPDSLGRRKIFSRVEVLSPFCVCTDSFLCVGSYDTEVEAMNAVAFLRTKFCRFLLGTVLLTQNISRSKFMFVPSLPMEVLWDDATLFEKYELNSDEIEFISQLIKD